MITFISAEGEHRAGWHSAAYLLETVPAVLYTLMLHGHSADAAILRAANDTWDSDTTAAIVGAAMGALNGAVALPRDWRNRLSGRTREAADDGRIPELIIAASGLWAPASTRG